MAKFVGRRPSAAMVVACIALIAALDSGTADQVVDFAKRAKLINGKKIQKRSIAGNRLRRAHPAPPVPPARGRSRAQSRRTAAGVSESH